MNSVVEQSVAVGEEHVPCGDHTFLSVIHRYDNDLQEACFAVKLLLKALQLFRGIAGQPELVGDVVLRIVVDAVFKVALTERSSRQEVVLR